jgi:hypothetical protein
MKANEFRIGNIIEQGTITMLELTMNEFACIKCDGKIITTPKPAILTEDWLLRLGFIPVKEECYINGTKWLMQVTDDYTDEDNIISRDGTWFDALGTYSFTKNGEMGVNTLCRGNYVCGSVSTVHQLQNLYFALTGEELKIIEP